MTRSSSSRVPEIRLRDLNRREVRTDGKYVLYWMIAARRARWNFALDRAVDLAREFDRPLIVLEALRAGYRWASDRIHRFVIDGMADNARAFHGTGVLYHPYVEPEAGAGDGLLEKLAADACAVVTDDYPALFLPRMTAAAAKKLTVRLEAVDSNGNRVSTRCCNGNPPESAINICGDGSSLGECITWLIGADSIREKSDAFV